MILCFLNYKAAENIFWSLWTSGQWLPSYSLHVWMLPPCVDAPSTCGYSLHAWMLRVCAPPTHTSHFLTCETRDWPVLQAPSSSTRGDHHKHFWWEPQPVRHCKFSNHIVYQLSSFDQKFTSKRKVVKATWRNGSPLWSLPIPTRAKAIALAIALWRPPVCQRGDASRVMKFREPLPWIINLSL